MHYVEEDQFHEDRIRPAELQQFPNSVSNQGERFVGQDGLRQEIGNSLYAHALEQQSRRRSDMILPSIERELHPEHSELTSLHGEVRQVNPHGSYQPLNRGMQPYPPPSIIDLDDYEELPSSKRRRIENQQPVNSRGQGRTILVPLEHIDHRRPRDDWPPEAMYLDDPGHFVSDKRIVPLPPKEERARSPIRHQELQLLSPRRQTQMHLDQVADRVDWYPQSRDHYQIPLSRSEKVEDSQFPSRAVFALPEYTNESPTFFDFPQSASRHAEINELGFASRHNARVVENSDRVFANSNGMNHHSQPLEEVAERFMPSYFGDMSINNRQREDDRRTDRVTYPPSTSTANFHTHTRPSTGAFQCLFATATADVHAHAGHAIDSLTYAPDTAKNTFYGHMELPTNAYPHEISERLPGLQQRPVWHAQQNASSYYQPGQHLYEPDAIVAVEGRPPPPSQPTAMEIWSDRPSNMKSRLS